MLDRFHFRKIDEAGLSPEQWRIVNEFICHNFGNLVGAATLTLGC
jgi:hypothetical protein